MSGSRSRLDPRPPELDAIPRDRSAVVEASAGTGKTYLIEHLALDLLIASGTRLPEVLLVTFTDKATRELRTRLRRRIRAACACAAAPGALDALGWRGDAEAATRLREALGKFDAASIATLHGFCESLLAEHAFAGGRLLQQERVDGRAAFGAAFREALRHELTGTPAERVWLEAFLAHCGNASELEDLLHACWRKHAPFSDPFDESRFASALQAVRAMGDLEPVAAGLKGSRGKAVRERLQRIGRLTARAETPDAVARAIARWTRDELDDVLDFLEERVPAMPAELRELRAAARSLSTVVAQRFLPVVARRLDARKQAAGQFDFDDMLDLVAGALDGPRGADIVAALRRRYRFAVVDEFQDTDEVQWRILRRIFFDSGRTSPLLVVGDPKQAIYGFRGADVAAYLAARAEIGGGAPALQLATSYRSRPRLVEALNLIFADDPGGFFTGRIRYDAPVRAHGNAEPEQAPPLHLLVLPAPDDGSRPSVGAARSELARRQADLVRAILAAPDAPAPQEIFVLARKSADADLAAQALREAGVPCVQYKRGGLFQTEAAGHVRDVLAALAEPRDRTRRLRALLTPFLGVSPGELPYFAELPDTHPLAERLREWTALAVARRYRGLARALLDGSGVGARLLRQADGLRQITDVQHVLDVLLAETAMRSMTVHELVQMLQAFIDGRRQPSADENEETTMRLESEAPAVQVMTMHASKGLEAEVVVVFPGPGVDAGKDTVLVHHRDKRREICLAADAAEVRELVEAERREEEQRLLYVALTRAKKRLVLPWLHGWPAEKLGCYMDVNRRLEDIAPELAARGLAVLDNGTSFPEPVADAAEPVQVMPPAVNEDHEQLVRRARGSVTTSYSRMKRELEAAAEAERRSGRDEPAAPEHLPPPLPESHLPAGAATGVFLHALLERMPLAPAPDDDLAVWTARPQVARLLDEEARANGVAAGHMAHAGELVWRGLRASLPLAGGRLEGLAGADGGVAREMEFLYPQPGRDGPALFHARDGQLDLFGARPAAGRTPARECDYVHGYIDVIYEHRGHLYVLDWKSDALPDWDEATVRRHVDQHYDVQIRLYTFAALQMLRIDNPRDFQRRFGGIQYVFLRGLATAPKHASVLIRPTHDEVIAWWNKLGATGVV